MCDAIIAVLYDSDLFALGIDMDDVEDGDYSVGHAFTRFLSR